MEGGDGARGGGGGGAWGESLFSLELLVESARVEPWLLPGPSPASSSPCSSASSACSWGPLRPAVALRLLDFPTLLVRAPQAALRGPLVPFGRGKSCLFRLRPESLREVLRRSPLYALLLGLSPSGPGPARLLASCSVSLADAAEELLLLPPGPSGGRGGRFPLRDLAGEPVGELALSYRLSNLGPCPRSHLGQGAAPARPCLQKGAEEPSKRQPSLELIPEGDEEQDLAPEPFSLGSASSGHAELPFDSHTEAGARSPSGTRSKSPTLPHSKSPTGIRSKSATETRAKSPTVPRSKSHTKARSRSPTETRRSSPTRTRSGSHSRPHSKSHTELSLLEADNELDIEANIFCPPPMYYTCPPASPSPMPPSTSSVIMTVAAAQESFPDEVVTVPSAVPLVEKEPARPFREATPAAQTRGSPEQLRQNLNQLPLLNALLVELSLLNNPSLQPHPSSVHPQLAWLYQNKEVAKAPDPCDKTVCPCCEEKKGTHHKDRGRSISPKLKRTRPEHLKCISPAFPLPCLGKTSPKIAYSERLRTEKNNAKENSPPRRKLTYGLTNTLRLRLQRSNPAMLKVHEKREHRRKKQGELVEKKKKTSSGKGKGLRGSPEVQPKSSEDFDEKSIPDQKAQINENVETLIQSSVDQICPTAKKGVVKNSDDGKQKVSYETIGSPCNENGLKFHLPAFFLQESESLENKIDTDVEKNVEHNSSEISSIQNDSQSNKLENSHEFNNVDGVQVNSGNTAYSEDFTSADISGPGLESQESSPDSLMESQDEDHSVLDSDSKISGRSHTTESISPPLPVLSAASPIQSFKTTHGLKSDTKSTGVLFSQLLGESSPPETVKEEMVAQDSVEEGGSRAVLQNKEVSSDLNWNIAKSQSVEKSSSLRTSQVSSYLPSNVSDIDLSGLEDSNASEKENEDFAVLNITNQCRHISELIVNKLPGYTM
ncbi:microtubule-associated protein 10 [Anolis sagrei]|uniref:microtubule-associated protein 10 n=1 Tax=Anolis sagrei TaxID=38937 RepID=UPI00352021B6